MVDVPQSNDLWFARIAIECPYLSALLGRHHMIGSRFAGSLAFLARMTGTSLHDILVMVDISGSCVYRTLL